MQANLKENYKWVVGKYVKFDEYSIMRIDNLRYIPINTVEDYEEFCRKVLNKTPSQIHAYWMKQVFLGKKTPPENYLREKVSQIIKNSKDTIGYSSQPLESKSIYEIK